jgi:hypothetical protein
MPAATSRSTAISRSLSPPGEAWKTTKPGLTGHMIYLACDDGRSLTQWPSASTSSSTTSVRARLSKGATRTHGGPSINTTSDTKQLCYYPPADLMPGSEYDDYIQLEGLEPRPRGALRRSEYERTGGTGRRLWRRRRPPRQIPDLSLTTAGAVLRAARARAQATPSVHSQQASRAAA